jgi:hypothetical protein
MQNGPRIRVLRPKIRSWVLERLLIFLFFIFFRIYFLRLFSILRSNFCTYKKSADFERFRQLTSNYERLCKFAPGCVILQDKPNAVYLYYRGKVRVPFFVLITSILSIKFTSTFSLTIKWFLSVLQWYISKSSAFDHSVCLRL